MYFTGDNNESTLKSVPRSMAGRAEAREMNVDGKDPATDPLGGAARLRSHGPTGSDYRSPDLAITSGRPTIHNCFPHRSHGAVRDRGAQFFYSNLRHTLSP
jgi:hypothetical protein